MSKTGIAMLSFAHVHARGYAKQVEDNPDAELVAIWDEDENRGKEESEKRGAPFYRNLDELLKRPEVEGVVVDAPTSMHPEVLIASARAGKHIFTEKALTVTTKEADEVVAEVKKSGVKFIISLPSRVNPDILLAKKVLDDGLLGQVTEMRARIAHSASLDKWFSGGSLWFGDEKLAGGGAFFDLGCHRVDVMRWFLGEPESVAAQMNNFSDAYPIDDNMAAVVQFKNKALGILDVSWVHRTGPNPLEIYGTEGFLGIGMAPGQRVTYISNKVEDGKVWITPTDSGYPKPPPMPMAQWVSAIRTGSPMTITIEDGRNLTELLDGCYQATRSGQTYRF